jgi:hypothetical protein
MIIIMRKDYGSILEMKNVEKRYNEKKKTLL